VFDVGERADMQTVLIAAHFVKIRNVADVDDDAVTVTRIRQPEKSARARAPANTSAMNERKAERFTQMLRTSNFRCFHLSYRSTRVRY
jgi:hypothetical protein